MDDYYLEPTPKTPKLDFRYTKGEFEVSGRSIPENSIDFYKPVLKWLDQYISEAKEYTHFSVNLEYFNTSSSKCLVEIFRRLEKLGKQEGKKVEVDWYYEEEDEDMKESGEDFKQIINLPIEMKEIRKG